MATRDANGLIQRPAKPAQTSTLNLYTIYGQSNSTGTNSTTPFTTMDATFGAITMLGRDGSRRRDGTASWIDQVNPPALVDFTLLPDSECQAPFAVDIREHAAFRALMLVNQRQLELTGQRHRAVVSCHGHTAYPTAQLIKGTNAYANLISAVTKMKNYAQANSLTPVYRGTLWVHGEADFAASGSGYRTTLKTLRDDLNTDIKAITGQAQNIPLFITQQSNFSNYSHSIGTISYPVLDQLQAHIDYPGEVILCTPMYPGENISTANPHYAGHQTARWAHGIGNAMSRVVVDGATWNPLRPKTITRNGAVVDIEFWVPTGSLVLDTVYAANTADGFYGFDFRQTGGTTTLTGVSLLNPTTLRFTLSAAPNGTTPRIRAGRNSSAAIAVSGVRTGARTCLRDSASDTPWQCNWCVHFDVDVP
jgi:hypothetical protein